MSRGEIQAFLSSIHVIQHELEKAKGISEKVQVELKAMETVLQRELTKSN